MDDNTRSLVARSEFSTTDPDTAEGFLRQNYIDNTLDITGPRDGFTFTHTTIAAPHASVNHLRIGINLAFDAEITPDDALVVAEPIGGGLGYVDNRYGDAHAGPGDALLCPPLGPTQIITERFDVRVTPLDRAAVADYAAAVTGLDPDQLDFQALVPSSPSLSRFWARTVAHVRDDILGDPWASQQQILLDQAFRTLAAALLSTFPNTAHDRATDPETPPVRGDVPAATLREVAEYLDHHADQPVGPTDIADLADAPYREVVESLRRREEHHPAELLWAARLRGVHRDLLDTDPHTSPHTGRTVTELAARWGFTHPARFRTAYAGSFGEWPEDTLRR